MRFRDTRFVHTIELPAGETTIDFSQDLFNLSWLELKEDKVVTVLAYVDGC